MADFVDVEIQYREGNYGRFMVAAGDTSAPIWSRLKVLVVANNLEARITETSIQVPWPDALNIVREFGTKSTQRTLNFRFRPDISAADRLKAFSSEIRTARASQSSLAPPKTSAKIAAELTSMGFVKRELKPFQLRDLSHLLALTNGANFSVPGAGKTTVTFALHLLTRKSGQVFFVVAPKAAFQAWRDIVKECLADDAPEALLEEFTVLEGREDDTANALASGATRFLISYDLMIRQQGLIASFLARTPVHLVLDEAHRMKAGPLSQRGAFLLNIATLPVRRDILTGTPMPQAATDIQSQLDFLWPGHGLGVEVARGKPPREVLGNLYVRTTKQELGLPKARRHFVDVTMKPGQLALYAIVRSEFLRQFSAQVNHQMGQAQFLKARRSVMRLLQLSVNPSQALTAMVNDDLKIESGIADAVVEEGHSAKLAAVMDHTRQLVSSGQKVVIWTIFTDTIRSLSSALADLNPVTLYGSVPSGSDQDADTREGRIKRFHVDPSCAVLIANPAAAGEGISLHTVCHNAIYADRSYVSTHYLQSIDRIHRLGLKPNETTDIFVYRSKAPPEIGSIDLSVSRRLTEKIRNMQMLLDDPDLHEIAFDEEEADDPVDYDVSLQDIIDLISELEGKMPASSDEDE
ncbi:MAG: helicase [Nitrobacter sp. 62-13]|uniref:SNF2-related protein n=1 Tax=Nitrobacter sp. 62-13 TaxID=1895797 RepID=UPI000969969A|nr:DEAD/DEAH box helicase [Nitrobacter sp. 62-13]OJU24026.1 MAG: helicase [Nitrobacter sp. 62-13]